MKEVERNDKIWNINCPYCGEHIMSGNLNYDEEDYECPYCKSYFSVVPSYEVKGFVYK